MSGDLRIIAPDLGKLAGDLGRAAITISPRTRPVIQRGAQNIKADAQRRVAGLPHAPAYPRSITYDTHESLSGPWAEIGPDKNKRQGSLGNLIEFGSVHNPGGRPHMRPAGEAEEPRLAKALEDLGVSLLEGL
jgi:hypothetical protein